MAWLQQHTITFLIDAHSLNDDPEFGQFANYLLLFNEILNCK